MSSMFLLLQDFEAVVQNAAREREEAASRCRAAEQQLAQESELRSSIEKHTAELDATIRSHEAEKAAHEAKVRWLIKPINRASGCLCILCFEPYTCTPADSLTYVSITPIEICCRRLERQWLS